MVKTAMLMAAMTALFGFAGAMLGTSYALGYSAGSYAYGMYQDS